MKPTNLTNFKVPTFGNVNFDSLELRNGRIERFVSADTNAVNIDCGSYTLLPGFIDVHNHGAVGVDVNTATVDDLLKVSAFLATKGVTAWLPTLVPDGDDVYERVIDAINEAMRRQDALPVAQIVGVHYEGVFASEAMCGALRPKFFRSGQWVVDGGQLPKLDHGVHMTTLAPEIDGGIDVVELLVADGWVVSIGHTKADTETLERAFAAGARHLTHFFNAMTPIHHREIGVAGWGISREGVTFDIIADGIHVAPEMVLHACRSRGTDSVSLISDSVAPTGLGDGEFELWDEKVSVVKGRTQNERGSIAGSVCTMADEVKLMHELGFSHAEIAAMASTNPATLLRLKDRGSIKAGNRADIVLVDDEMNVISVFVGGQIV
ncbi:MAG: N-acetylglucosamine-6-phosphate deacetylase [Blastocatellia bacterium]|nr:N-acetylglucosamine-6-phosphate deacetylase [Blastocatellia bacterium]